MLELASDLFHHLLEVLVNVMYTEIDNQVIYMVPCLTLHALMDSSEFIWKKLDGTLYISRSHRLYFPNKVMFLL